MSAHRFRAGDTVKLAGVRARGMTVVCTEGEYAYAESSGYRFPVHAGAFAQVRKPATDVQHRAFLHGQINQYEELLAAARANLAALEEGGES